MNEVEYEEFLEELTARLEADPAVLGLVALGSTADASSRDRWSDHDFWIITAPGSQSTYLDSFSWLPQADRILLTVRHGASYRGALYENRHKVEYAVFDSEEAASGKIERFRLLIDRQEIRELVESIRLQTHEERAATLARPDMLENLCMLVLTAHERWERGELLSARRYVQFAVDAFLDRLAAHGVLNTSPAADRLEARRRLEQLEPELARELNCIVGLDATAAGVALLELAQGRLRAQAPELAWDKVSLVEQWLQEAVRAGGAEKF